ncbi:toxin Cry1Ac domain D-VI-related protein [Latilactobacillus sakei]|uniref:toxin Cry1Ac domain D-VI-related protein n=1 Tax=Latilactobacillus sakei TaxID=1599 RepID=UPI000DC64938|nr:toxin Cry1Ac domain D-VI-related protein [Latilactobacillus sakei]SPS04297.1 hypothetical protein LAS9624_01137 [Latilactobacillus sakei]
MVKKRVLLIAAMASLGLLSACGNQAQHNDSNVRQTSKKSSALENAKMNVDGLFSDSKHTKLLEGTTYKQIKSVSKEVSKLSDSKEKEKLLKDILNAQKLWPDFINKTNKKNSESTVTSESKASSESESEKTKSESESAAKKAAQDSESKATSESIQAKEAAKTDEEKTADKLEKNVLFGYLDKSKAKKVSSSYYQLKDFDYAHVGIGDHNIIKAVKLDFKDTPLMNKDEAVEYVQSFTADDATKVSERDNNSDYFHSSKTGLDYLVRYTINDNGISLILIYPKQ